MWKTIVPAAAVLAAEAVIRRKINALPAETFPLRIGQRVQLRRAHNRGLLCSKFARKPRAAAALQTASAAALAAVAAVCACRRGGTALQIGMGLMLGVRVKAANGDVVAACRDEGLLTVPAGDNVVRFLPPLIITDVEIGEAVDAFERALAAVAAAA